jgi:hypothetical protein
MSIDPDDVTRRGFSGAGADHFYGTPDCQICLRPGWGNPLLGLRPVLYHKVTLDFMLFIPAGERPTRKEIAALARRSRLNCPECRYRFALSVKRF